MYSTLHVKIKNVARQDCFGGNVMTLWHGPGQTQDYFVSAIFPGGGFANLVTDVEAKLIVKRLIHQCWVLLQLNAASGVGHDSHAVAHFDRRPKIK